MSTPSDHYDLPPLRGTALGLTTFAVALVTFMNVLDLTICNVSIPAIAGDIGVSPNQGTWVITSFAVANAISVPLTGWLTQRFGSVRLFVTSVLLFVLFSLACGLAQNLQMLVLFRVLQGAVAGPTIPLSQALLLQCWPKEKAGVAMAVWGISASVPPVLGPLMGGWISDNLSWPWIFYINVPAGLLAASMSWSLLRRRETPTSKMPIDSVGLILLAIWVGALQLMLDTGKDLDWFSSSEIRILAGAAVIAFCFFIAWELTDDHPVVDLRLFRNRNFTTGTISLALGFSVFLASIVLIPLWMQQVLGHTPTWAGIVLSTGGIFAILLTPLIAKLLPNRDPRYFACVAFLLLAFVSMMRSGFTLEATPWIIIVPHLLQGAAVALFLVPLTTLSFSGLPQSRIAAAAGLSNAMRMIIGAFGVSLMTTMWGDRAAFHHARLVESVTVYDSATRQALGGLSAQGPANNQAMALIEHQVTAQAYMLSTCDLFAFAGVLLLLLAAAIWLAKPEGQAATPAVDVSH